MEKVTVNIKRLNVDAKEPSYANPGDAGMDLYASERIVAYSNRVVAIPTGIAMEIPEGHVGFIWDKSGLALNGIKTMAGVIDSGYRGEVKVVIINFGDEDLVFEKGNKVAQMIIQEKKIVKLVSVNELTKTERGEGGFGSSGKK